MKRILTFLMILMSGFPAWAQQIEAKTQFKEVASEGDQFRIIHLVTPFGECGEDINRFLTPNAEIRMKPGSVRIINHACTRHKFNVIEISGIVWEGNVFQMKIQSANFSYAGDANGDTDTSLSREVIAEDQLIAVCGLSRYRRRFTRWDIPSPYEHHILECKLVRAGDQSNYGSITLRN